VAGRGPRAGNLGDRELKLAVLAVGRCRDRRINLLCEDYLKRIRKHLGAGLVEIEGRTDRAVTDGIRRACGRGTHVVALDAGGAVMDSERFASHLAGLLSGHAKVVFLVGGAEGLPGGAGGLVHERLSLSAMTLPHRLARLLILEQIYRALSIASGEPYHR
jgi:23S rRNA (pseudouridine1915-N3)-methyltransferase